VKGGIPRESTVSLTLIILFLLTFLVYAVKPGGANGIKAFGDIVYVLYAGIAAIIGFIAVRLYGTRSPQGKILRLLAIATALDAIAGVVWLYYEVWLGLDSPFPTPADYLWLLFYVIAISGLVYALWKVKDVLSTRTVLITLVGWGMLVYIVWTSILRTIFVDPTQSAWLKFLSAEYPLGDLILILLAALIFLTLRKGMFGATWLAFLLAYASFAVGDLNYGAQLIAGTFQTGSFIDLFWYACHLLLAYSFYLQIKAILPTERAGTKFK
jgi:hypothetical protein